MYLILLFLTSFNLYGQKNSCTKLILLNDIDSITTNHCLVKRWVENAKIVGLGESAHDMKEFTQARTQIANYLISDHGYRHIVFEMGFLKGKKIDSYLKNCSQGKPGAKKLENLLISLGNGLSNFRDQIASWCEVNTKAKKQVISFDGMDIWDNPWEVRDEISSFVSKVNNKKLLASFNKAKTYCMGWRVDNFTDMVALDDWKYFTERRTIDNDDQRLCHGSLLNLRRDLLGLEVDSTLKTDHFWAKIGAASQIVWHEYRVHVHLNYSRFLNLRDRFQAQTILALHKFRGEKTILMAHNVHISKKQSVVVPSDPEDHFVHKIGGGVYLRSTGWVDVKSAGQWLSANMGNKYKAIALTAHEVANEVASNDDQSLDLAMAQMSEFAFVDPTADWIMAQNKWRMHVGGAGGGGYYLNPKTQYDGIFFTKKASAEKPL